MLSAHSPTQFTRKRQSRYGQSLDSEAVEERRLLGLDSKKDDEQAVSIKKPRTSWEVGKAGNMPGKIIAGGIRPRNTLNTSNNKQTFHREPSSASKYTPSTSKALQVETVRGKNVKNHSTNLDLSGGFTEPPSAKRRKTETVSIDSSSNSDKSSDDPIKGVPSGKLHMWPIQNQSQRAGRKPSSPTQDPTPESALRMGSWIPEYSRVETLMNSNPRFSKHKKRERNIGTHFARAGASETSSPPFEGESNSSQVDTSSKDDRLYKASSVSKQEDAPSGTTEVAPVDFQANGITDEKLLNDVPRRSPFWSAAQKPLGGKLVLSSESPPPPDKTPHQAPMNKQFIAINGKRRGDNGQGSSPDELLSGNTIGKYVNQTPISPSKRQRTGDSPKPTPFVKVMATRGNDTGLDPSNIKPTNFGTSRPARKRRLAQEARPPYSLDIVAINLPGNDVGHRNDNLGLVHDESKDHYVIRQEGKPLESDNIALTVKPAKLQKVFFEEEGRRIRFSSMKTEGEDNILDIEIAKEKDKQQFLERLQTKSGCQVHACTSEKMEKMFETRRKQPKPTRASNVIAEPVPCFPLEPSSLKSSSSKNATNKARTSVVGELMDRASENTNVSQHHLRSMSSTASSTLLKHELKQDSSISRILHGLKPEPLDHNNHLRRSTRTSSASNNVMSDKWYNFEESEVTKYSKVHGLGKKWKKPLTFPKTGKKKATVEFVDLERLDEGEFLNDTLVTFHMRFLEHQVMQERPQLARRIYFFSTFFYQRLTDFAKGTREINYAAVQSWTRNVDIFTYDYVVVPINESAHWYLAIICNLPALDRKVLVSDEDDNDIAEAQSPTPQPLTSQDSEGTIVKDTEPSVPREEDPVEKGTRESFAELKLDTKHTRQSEHPIDQGETVGDQEAKYNDTEMLDGPDDNIWNSNSPNTHGAPFPSPDDDPIEDPDPKAKDSSLRKKGKRKSLPPITHMDPRRPLIITFDSLGAPHGTTIRFLKDYLLREMSAKRGPTDMDIGSIKGINAKCIPQQNNFSDCGLYMLGYLDKFMEDGPSNFIARTIKREYKDEDWSKLVPNEMRSNLRDRLLNLGGQQDEEVRASKTKRRNTDMGSSATSPMSSSAPSAIGQPQTNPSSKLTSPRSSPAPPLRTRREALETAHSLGEADTSGPNDSLKEEEHNIQPKTNRSRRRSGSREPLKEIPLDEASLILVESQSQKPQDSEPPSSQMPGDFVEAAQKASPELPSEVADSQDPMPAREPYSLPERASKPRHGAEQSQDQPPEEEADSESITKIYPTRTKFPEPSLPKQTRHTKGSELPRSPEVDNNATLRTSKRNKTKRSRDGRAVEVEQRGGALPEDRDVINID